MHRAGDEYYTVVCQGKRISLVYFPAREMKRFLLYSINIKYGRFEIFIPTLTALSYRRAIEILFEVP